MPPRCSCGSCYCRSPDVVLLELPSPSGFTITAKITTAVRSAHDASPHEPRPARALPFISAAGPPDRFRPAGLLSARRFAFGSQQRRRRMGRSGSPRRGQRRAAQQHVDGRSPDMRVTCVVATDHHDWQTGPILAVRESPHKGNRERERAA